MGIVLYKHNLEAYRKAAVMLEHEGKAAVIHPTGTGKSYIGFKLCEEHPDRRICWLSPSEYIFRTQIEGLRNSIEAGKGVRAVDDYAHEINESNENQEKSCVCPYNNLRFVTYAKLSYMTESQLSELAPDYIILDEFHRCGAEVWGTGVQRLLAMYPDAKLLGLSARQKIVLQPDIQSAILEAAFFQSATKNITVRILNSMVSIVVYSIKFIIMNFYRVNFHKIHKMFKIKNVFS